MHTENTYNAGARANQGEVARPEPPRLPWTLEFAYEVIAGTVPNRKIWPL
jgi:hypothetical protein